MEFSDVLAKIANNARLTPQEMDFLKRMGDDTQRRNSQVANIFASDGNVSVNEITTQRLNIGKEVYLGIASRYYYNNLSCSHGAYTDVPSWTADYEDNGFYTSGKYIYIPQTGRYQVILHNSWDINSAGARDAGSKINDVGQSPYAAGLASTFGYTYLNAVDEKEYIAGDRISMTVIQTSGGVLNLQAAWLVFRRIR